MKALRLFKALSMVDEKWVEEAWDYQPRCESGTRPCTAWRPPPAVLYSAHSAFSIWSPAASTASAAPLPKESPAESMAEGGEVSEDVAADNGSDGVSYLSYAGPVLPLTVLEQDTPITAAREMTWDVSSDQGPAHYADAYTLTNPTAQSVTVTALYPFAGNFRDLADQQPAITVDGQTVTPQLHPGAYAGSFTGTGDGPSRHVQSARALLLGRLRRPFGRRQLRLRRPGRHGSSPDAGGGLRFLGPLHAPRSGPGGLLLL